MSKRFSPMSLSIALAFMGSALLFILPYLSPTSRADSPVFGPERFVRQKEPSNSASKTFSIQDTSGRYVLTVQNPEGKRGRFSSAHVELNGVRVIDASEFNADKDFVSKGVRLGTENRISVEITSEFGTSVLVSIHDSSTNGASPQGLASASQRLLAPQVQAVAPFEHCLQDDSTGNRFQFSSTNGEYRFTRVSDSFTLTGTGTVTVRGSSATLQHFADDRRVSASIDTSVKRGTASVQVIPLQVTFSVADKNTTNNNCSVSIGAVRMTPDALFVGEPASITVQASIPYDSSQGPPAVTLQRVSPGGVVTNIEGGLADDGNLSNGDEIAGDGIFSLRKPFSSQTEERIRLRVAVQQSSLNISSGVLFLDVFTHLTDAQLDSILSSQNTARQTYDSLLPSMGSSGARDAVLTQVRQDPSVLQADVSENGNGIWMLYSSGTLGSLILNTPGTRGSAGLKAPPASGATVASRPEPPAAFMMAASDIAIKNKKAIVLSPFLFQFGDTDEGPDVRQILENSACPAFNVTTLTDSAVTVNVIKTLHQYGLVVMPTHGDTYYKGLLSLWQERFGWSFIGAQVVFLTGQTATASNKVDNEIDLKKGRLAITNNGLGYYAVLPSFISYYGAGSYPDSLVYIGACRSTFNNSMANAFLNNGAKTYLGYSEYVDSGFAGNAARDFFHKFIEVTSIANTGQAFTAGQNDGGTPPAFFHLRGANNLAKPSSGLENGGFEAGVLGAWTASGDGRVVSQLGEFSPVEGFRAGLISTGLGFTVASGSIEQKVCLPANAQRLEFNWNFNSEEFIEYCNTVFQDFLQVEIITDTGTHNLFFRKVDDLCPNVAPSGLHFDASSGFCNPGAGNDCKVWTTGWRFESINIAAIAAANQNRPVTIRFSAGDVGDSIFDTAILLDNVRVVTP